VAIIRKKKPIPMNWSNNRIKIDNFDRKTHINFRKLLEDIKTKEEEWNNDEFPIEDYLFNPELNDIMPVDSIIKAAPQIQFIKTVSKDRIYQAQMMKEELL